MGMVPRQRPGQTKGFRVDDDLTQAFNEIIPVLIICEYSPALDSPDDHMQQRASRIYPRFPWRDQ
jgi:hypothetical protein